MSQKPTPKMCKSPKSSNYQNAKPVIDKMVDYETLNTTCTVVGSNNLHLVKKPQMLTAASPVYSNPSPGYPQSPYSSPASLKSPSPSLKPPTPQPSFPVMQIIHNNTLLARPIQSTQPQNIIKLKPHLNILPKPSASPQPPPKPSVSPQIVIPTNQQATIVPTAPPLLLNQMPMITPGVQFIIRPQTAKISAQMPTAAPQGLILQPSGQQLLQIQPPRSQPMVRVLTNGVQLGQPTTTYVTTTHLAGQPQHNNMGNVDHQSGSSPKKKPKKKKQKLDLANIMKLSGIGDEDDIQFESDTSQSESDTNTVVPGVPVIQHSSDTTKKMSNIQISAVTAQPTINATATPLLQVLNQNFQGGVLSNATAAQPQAQAGLPFSPFITPNFTINNGLMLQRSSGGFKLTMGEDGRLVLQHDPTLNQDLQSQLLLQSIFGLNGGLVLQPSIDQQVHSQTVQTIQQQSVQTIQQQTVQSQTIQTVQQQTVQPHSLQTIQQTIQPQIQPQTVQQTVQQTIQHQTVQSQPISSLQQHAQPVQLVQPQQQLHNLQSQIQNLLQQQPLQGLQQRGQTQQNQPVLKVQPFQKNQQPPVHAVHPQIQQENRQNTNQPTSYVVNLTPEQLEQLKRNGQLTVNGQTIYMQRNKEQTNDCKNKLSPKLKATVKKINSRVQCKDVTTKTVDVQKEVEKTSSNLLNNMQQTPKHILPQSKPTQTPPKVVQSVVPPTKITKPQQIPTADVPQDVERLLGQILEESNAQSGQNATAPSSQQQRVHTIQLTPQKQQHLKSIQLQIQTLSARLTPGDVVTQNALKLLFTEQQKILASGKLLQPSIYHNNQLTINAASLENRPEVQSRGVVDNGALRKEEAESATLHHVTPSVSQQGHGATPSVVPTQHSIQQVPEQVPSVPQGVALPQVQATQSQVPHHHHHHHHHHHNAPLQQPRFIPSFTKEQLIEQQLNTDQNGAVNPDIHTPFRDKGDACKRLIRYHCFDQPVLSQKDLDKADEIFELTARHFIDKFSRMVDKYRYLLLKESMRPVQTSELMMLDRMFVGEEQQSLMRLRQELEESPPVTHLPSTHHHQPQASSVSQTEEYDEWACIQRELGCLQATSADEQRTNNVKRSASSDSRLETLKRFRVEKHKKCGGESVANKDGNSKDDIVQNNSIDEQVQSAIDSILNLQQNTCLDLDESVANILS